MLRFIQSRTIHTVALCLGSFGLGSACDQQTNDGAGPGFKGISAGGNGTVGQTEFKSTSSSNFHAGVLGQDISTSGSFDAGVFGKSSIGIGVEGSSVSGNGVQSVSLKDDGTNSGTQNESITSAEDGRESGVTTTRPTAAV